MSSKQAEPKEIKELPEHKESKRPHTVKKTRVYEFAIGVALYLYFTSKK